MTIARGLHFRNAKDEGEGEEEKDGMVLVTFTIKGISPHWEAPLDSAEDSPNGYLHVEKLLIIARHSTTQVGMNDNKPHDTAMHDFQHRNPAILNARTA
jgi:hypothetical protein